MFKNLNRLSSSLQWKIPLLALSLTLGAVAESTSPVFAVQTQTTQQSQTVSVNSQTTTGSFSSYSSSQSTSIVVSDDTNYSHSWTTSSQINDGVKQYQASISSTSSRKRTTLPQEDGVYLYGQSSQAGQLGKGYIIFERKRGRVTGALYMPSSEFSCFRGTLRGNGKLAMTVNGYPGETSTPQIASTGGLSGAQNAEATAYDYSLKLQDYHRVNSIGSIDRKILQMCKSS